MNSLICPTCGCSLVRLGIAPVPPLCFRRRDIDHFFCCSGCRDLFIREPERHLQETESLEVCPVCSAEKPAAHTIRVDYGGNVLHFCRCPHCLEEFHRQPAYYVDRLTRRIEYSGVFGGESTCCPPPPLSSSVVLQSIVTCPNCGHQTQETMPTDNCLFFYECLGCHTTLRPKPGHYCVFCSYGSVSCRSIQSEKQPA
jgi:YHS domain-containing protein